MEIDHKFTLMPRSYVDLYVHAIWAVKKREPLLQPSLRTQLIRHILLHFQNSPLRIIRINGIEDHLHCLFHLPSTYSVAQTVKLIKGESSFWINEQKAIDGLFRWQEGYAAFSVDRISLNKIVSYIEQQEERHKKLTFEQELSLIEKKLS